MGVTGSLTDRTWRLLVAGDLRPAADGATTPTTSPSTGAHLADAPAATPADVDVAVRAAEAASREWRTLAPVERAATLRALAVLVRKHRGELAELDAHDCGNPVTAMAGDVDQAAELLERTADWAAALDGTAPRGDADHLHYTVREPFGVVARIVPYNHPVMFAISKLAAPLLAGNGVVLKAPDQAPLSTLRLGELLAEADLVPRGLVSLLSGAGAVVGPAMIAHPLVRRIAFTGSVATGQSVLQTAAGAGIKSVSLELGGKNPMIVLPDADAAAAAAGAVTGMNFHWTGGQSCGSTSRLLVHRSLVDEVVERVVAGAAAVRLGDPLDPATEMGTMVTAAHRDRVLGFVNRALTDGAKLATGGGAPERTGAYIQPTVCTGVDPGSELATTEVFGPVLAVIAYDHLDDAIAIANATPYGLTASIWTRDLSTAHRTVGALEAGYVWVNTVSRHFAGMPFGGVKDSGLGREESVEELHSFTQTKAVTVRLDPRTPPQSSRDPAS
ncbi:MAG: 2-formylbenzoate dehydrogenase [Pseudonocardiales bacterium]|jgi:acyl-CoA reductase-like NAD-dependent aldehyde dehydrogenase|nr:2-formylbenzoate dehydrogenase [Pseudonocardiales bacterium]